jgi:hypothetical protein
MYLQKVTSRKDGVKKLVFFWHLEGQKIAGSGSTPKCHGSGTLLFILF